MWLLIVGAVVLLLFVAAGADDARRDRAEQRRHGAHTRPRAQRSRNSR